MSFTLELRFRGVVLIDQHDSGSTPGLHLFMPSHSHHRTTLRFDPRYSNSGSSFIELVGPYDLSAAGSGGKKHKLNKFMKLSDFEVGPVAIHEDWFNTSSSPAGLHSYLRLPLAKSIKEDPEVPAVELTFTKPPKKKRDTFAGGGIITVDVDQSTLNFGGTVLSPIDGRMMLSLWHAPDHEVDIVPPCDIPDHHISAMYTLLEPPGRPSKTPPTVYYHARIPSPTEEELHAVAWAMVGGDPAQCTPGGI